MDQKWQVQVTSKCEHKVVRKFVYETKKLMHSLCPTDKSQQQQNSNAISSIYLS